MIGDENFLSSNLKYLRCSNKKNLKEIGKVVNKTDVAIHYWEDGSREPNSIDLYKLSNYYNISIDDLIKKDLRLQNNIVLDKEHKLDRIITEKSYQMSEEDKKMIINIMDSINARNDIKGSDNLD